MLDGKLRRDLPIAPELYLEVLHRLGFVADADAGLYRNLLAFYGSQVLGFYEPEDDEMVLVKGSAVGASAVSLVWAHELAHAEQQARFSLPSRLLAMTGNGDAQRAASAVAEGEAMLVMLFVSAPADGRAETALHQADAIIQGQGAMAGIGAGIPDYFVQDLLFPYTAGLGAVVRAYRAGGWQAVDRMLARPPSSTAALLHPDAGPWREPLSDRELPATPPGWSTVFSDTLGEWGMSFWLSRTVGEEAAAAAAAGWDGDRIRIIRRRDDPQRWAAAWRLRVRPGRRSDVETVLRRALPDLLAGFDAPPPHIAWSDGADWVEVRVGWPSRRPPSP